MSTYSQERADLLLPSAAVVPFRNALVGAINQKRTEWLELATMIHAHLRSERGAADRQALNKLLRSEGGSPFALEDFMEKQIQRFSIRAPSLNFFGSNPDGVNAMHRREAIMDLLIHRPEAKPGEPRPAPKLQAPKKKDLPLLLASKTWTFANEECSIRIDPKTRMVHWRVPENNNAVDYAHESALGRAFFQALKNVAWTRGTGGAFRYTDEHMRDAAMDHGVSSVSLQNPQGPLGQEAMEAETGYRPPRRSPGMRR